VHCPNGSGIPTAFTATSTPNPSVSPATTPGGYAQLRLVREKGRCDMVSPSEREASYDEGAGYDG
jgi:hypothetical protein